MGKKKYKPDESLLVAEAILGKMLGEGAEGEAARGILAAALPDGAAGDGRAIAKACAEVAGMALVAAHLVVWARKRGSAAEFGSLEPDGSIKVFCPARTAAK